MAKKEQNSGFSEYKGFIKPLIKVVSAILFLIFLYLVYTPTDIKSNDMKLTAGDWVFLLALALLFIAAIIYYYSPKQLLFSLRGTSNILDNHPRGAYISFFVCIGGAIVIIEILIGFSSSLAKVLVRLSSPDEPLNIRNILLGLAGMAGLTFAGWRSWALGKQTQEMEKSREIVEDRRLDERFANAVEFLSKELNETSYPAHLGAITELSNLAVDSTNYTQRCLDMLCSYNQWMEGYLYDFEYRDSEYCYTDRHLTETSRIAPHDKVKDGKVTLFHERRSQTILKLISSTIIELNQRDSSKKPMNGINLSGQMLCGINLYGVEIAGINLKNACLNGANLGYANMQGASLVNANLQEAFLYEAQLQGASLINANLKKADLSKIQAARAKLNKANLQEAMLYEAQLQGASLIKANLEKANLSQIQAARAKLNNANLQGAMLYEAQLQGSSLVNANLKKADLSQIQATGAKLNNANLQGALLYEAQLQGASLISANLKKADLEDADLREANLTDANLQKAQCAETIFEKATLVKANLKEAYLSESVLRYTDLTGANLYETDLTEASIYGANFHNANIQKATLIGADITESDLVGANMAESNLQGISIEKTNCRSTIFNQAKMHAVDFIDCDLQGSIFISSELQSASFNESNLEKCTLLGCNLYGVEMKSNNLQNIIFDAISDTGHIKTKGARNTWIKGIGKGFSDSTNDEEHISRIQQAWNKTDKGEMPKGLNALQQASILEKDATGRWVIMPSKIEELKEFYRALITESDKGLFIPISDSMDIISKDHGHLSKDYPEIQKTLKAILVEFKKELKK